MCGKAYAVIVGCSLAMAMITICASATGAGSEVGG